MSTEFKYGPGPSSFDVLIQTTQRVQAEAKQTKEQLKILQTELDRVQTAFSKASSECLTLKEANSQLEGRVTLLQAAGASAASAKLDLTTENSRLQIQNLELEATIAELHSKIDSREHEALKITDEISGIFSSLEENLNSMQGALRTSKDEKASLESENRRLSEMNEQLEAKFNRLQLNVVKTVSSGVLGRVVSNAASIVAKKTNPAVGTQTEAPVSAAADETHTETPVPAAAVATHTERTMGTKLFAGSVVFLVGIGAVIAKNPGAQDTFVKAGQVFASSVLKGVALVPTFVGKLLSPNGCVIDLGKNAN